MDILQDDATTPTQLEQCPTPSQRHGVPLPVIIWLRLLRIYQKIDRRTAETMKTWHLSVSRFDVLNHAGTQEGRTQQELADALLVTKGNVTQLLDAMEADHLLYRQKEGRTNRVYLTDRGRDLRNASLRDHEAHICKEFSVLSVEEQETLLHLLRKLDRHL